MPLRFRKRIKLAPGIRMNLSGSGISWTLGPRGASFGLGRRGARFNAGLPGTGLHSSTPLLGRAQPRPSRASAGTYQKTLTVRIQEDGAIALFDENGTPASDTFVAAAKEQRGDTLRELLQEKVDEINDQIEELGRLHHETPPPDSRPIFEPCDFDEERPSKPPEFAPTLLDKVMPGRVKALEAQHHEAVARFKEAHRQWEERRSVHAKEQSRRKFLIETLIYKSPTAMESFLEEVLQEIIWPRETDVTFEVSEDGQRVSLAVDLPEVEDFPRKVATMPARGYKASIKDMSDTALRKLYMNHVHAVGFRIIGETFAALPTASETVLTAYSQRTDKATGHVQDEYLYSVRVTRSAWSRTNFAKLASIDVVESLGLHEIRRDMTKTGIFKAVTPFS